MVKLIAWFNNTRKVWASVTVATLGWATAVVLSDEAAITAGEWVSLATVVAVAAGVWKVANVPLPE